MKSHIILLFALLLAAFMLSCQQQESGPTGPEALQTLAKKPVEALFDVTLDGNFLSSPTPLIKDNIGNRRGIVVQNATLDFNAFFEDKLSCSGEIIGDLTGVFVLNSGSNGNGHAFLGFQFTHNDIFYALELWGIIADTGNWPPSPGSDNTMTELELVNGENGHWKLKATGRNHQNGCIGEGEGLIFTATVHAQTL